MVSDHIRCRATAQINIVGKERSGERKNERNSKKQSLAAAKQRKGEADNRIDGDEDSRGGGGRSLRLMGKKEEKERTGMIEGKDKNAGLDGGVWEVSTR